MEQNLTQKVKYLRCLIQLGVWGLIPNGKLISRLTTSR